MSNPKNQRTFYLLQLLVSPLMKPPRKVENTQHVRDPDENLRMYREWFVLCIAFYFVHASQMQNMSQKLENIVKEYQLWHIAVQIILSCQKAFYRLITCSSSLFQI
ncbi:Hypothetical_protein [Hexamita inflata]|uniref:Hypothetical_protein n=1 Tax=Hexamita inflata TaxID=28002 RepID=A0AA86UC78_9EUKA|nr:Hypothetical protein HINF_LOCUS37544 [Hexamita inflata]